jgi:hypothetical protein
MVTTFHSLTTVGKHVWHREACRFESLANLPTHMSKTGQKSQRRTSSSKGHNSSSGQYAQSEAHAEPAVTAPVTTSFLFIVTELPTNDDPDTPNSVPPRYVSQRWHPPITMRGFFDQQPGRVYRWNDGVVSLAEGYEWTSRPIGTPPYANGTIFAMDPDGETIWPEYFRAATVFYCNHFDKFFTTRGDAGTREIAVSVDAGDWWQPLTFFHDHDISYVDHAGDQEYLAVRNAPWIEQLLPREYRRPHHGGPADGGLAGLLPIVIALVAFSCADAHELHRILIRERAWSGHRWRPHQRGTGRMQTLSF